GESGQAAPEKLRGQGRDNARVDAPAEVCTDGNVASQPDLDRVLEQEAQLVDEEVLAAGVILLEVETPVLARGDLVADVVEDNVRGRLELAHVAEHRPV